MEKWFTINSTQAIAIPLSVIGFYLGLLLLVRLNGLRSFSKMSGHDFAVTVAIGSVFATTVVNKNPNLWAGLLAVTMLLLSKKLLSYIRFTEVGGTLLDNTPIIVMRDGEFLHDNLRKTEVTERDVYAKLRECNALNLGQVRAVVVETSGDVSVLHGSKEEFDPALLEGCRS